MAGRSDSKISGSDRSSGLRSVQGSGKAITEAFAKARSVAVVNGRRDQAVSAAHSDNEVRSCCLAPLVQILAKRYHPYVSTSCRHHMAHATIVLWFLTECPLSAKVCRCACHISACTSHSNLNLHLSMNGCYACSPLANVHACQYKKKIQSQCRFSCMPKAHEQYPDVLCQAQAMLPNGADSPHPPAENRALTCSQC